MIFVTWLSLNGIENRHIKKDLTGLLKCIFYWGKQKGQLTTFCWSFFVDLYCTSMWAEFKNKKRSY